MLKMKKTITALLAGVMALSVLTACGGKTTNDSTKSAGSTTKWPEKTVQVTVPYAAGGDTDIYARLSAQYLSEILGQTFIIVNAPGASGILASKQVMAAKPDGYTVLFNHTAGLIQEATGLADFSYADSFEAGGNVAADNTYTLIARTNSGWKSLQDMVAYAKANPGKVSYSQVNGSVTHYVSTQLEKSAGIELNKLDVGSSNSDRIAAFLGGQVDLVMANYASVKDYVEAGKAVALAVASSERAATLKDLPTFKEQGVDVVADKKYSYKFPKGTDKAIVDKFTAALKQVAEKQEFKDKLAKYFAQPSYLTPEDTVKAEKEEVVKIKEIMKDVLKKQ